MSKQTIFLGNTPNDRTGDPLRTAFEKVNENFTELYANLETYLPSPTGNDGKFLTTDGIDLIWTTITIDEPVPISAGSTPPATNPAGTLWFDNVSGRLYVYYDSSWIDASPKGVASSIMSGTKTSTATGTVGQITYDDNYIYICTATNTWKRSPLTGGY
jgi:hypothetical protein